MHRVNFKIPVAVFLACGPLAAAQPSADDLIEEYTRTLERLKSFALRFEDEYTAELDLSFLPGRGRRKTTGGYLGEVRSDGARHYMLEKSWDAARPGMAATRAEAQNDPRYNSYLWDGKRVFQYQRSNRGGEWDRLFLTPENHKEARGENIISTNRSHILLGYFEDTMKRAPYQYRRIDEELRQCTLKEILPQTENVGDAACRVLVARSADSRYKLWIDPQHSFHIARAEITRGGPGVAFGNPEEVGLQTRLRNVRFQKTGDVWAPVEADWGYEKTYIRNGFSRENHHHRIPDFQLNPDHDALGSFDRHEIRDGARALIVGRSLREATWKNGRVLDSAGNTVLDCREK